jgi:hypothetical protein
MDSREAFRSEMYAKLDEVRNTVRQFYYEAKEHELHDGRSLKRKRAALPAHPVE